MIYLIILIYINFNYNINIFKYTILYLLKSLFLSLSLSYYTVNPIKAKGWSSWFTAKSLVPKTLHEAAHKLGKWF